MGLTIDESFGLSSVRSIDAPCAPACTDVLANVALSASVMESMKMEVCTEPICSASLAARSRVSSPEYCEAM